MTRYIVNGGRLMIDGREFKDQDVISDSDLGNAQVETLLRYKTIILLNEPAAATVATVPSKGVVDGDLNNDGVFDKKDKSIAGKILRCTYDGQ